MTLPVYIAPRTPGAEPSATTEWLTVCHSREPFVWVHYDALRSTSRWVSVPRARPYLVERHRRFGRFGGDLISAHKTLDAALKAAAKIPHWVKERA